MIQTLKYCSFRLFFTIFLFYPFLVVLGLFSNKEIQGFMGDDRPLLLVVFFLILIVVSAGLSFAGKRRIEQKLESLKRKRDNKVKETIRSFERLLTLTYSALFIPLSGERFRKQIIGHFADLLATESIDLRYSRNILETAVMNANASSNVEAFLAKNYINQNRLDDQELFCAEIICMEKPNETVLLDKMVEEYLSRRSTGVKARNIFRIALMRHRPQSLEIVYLLQKDYLENGSIDELGAWVFLVIMENKEEFNLNTGWLREQLREAYRRFGEREDELASRLKAIQEWEVGIYEKADYPVQVKGEAEASFDPITISTPALQQQENEPENVEPEVSLMSKLPEIFTRKESLPLYITGATLIVILIFMVTFFQEEEETQVVLMEKKVEPPVALEEPKIVETPVEVKKEGSNAVVSDLPFTIQLAAYKEIPDAQKFISSLKGMKKKVYVNIRKSGSASTLYRVRLGFFKSQEEARSYATKLKEKGTISSFFISSFDGGVWKLD